ncbi:MAG: hypothetical protein ACRDPD_18415, partial [Streptosporangiaceae bacterium]
GGTCIGTVIGEIQLGTAAQTSTLRVIVYDAADPGGVTVAAAQAAGTGQITATFGVHQVFDGLTAVCLAATTSVAASPDMPCLQFGQQPPAPQATQPAATASATPTATAPPTACPSTQPTWQQTPPPSWSYW